MNIARKVFSGCSSLVLSALLISGATTARADSDSDNTPNYGVRGKRITSDCAIRGGVLVFPQVPPPPTIADPNLDPCHGKVVALEKIRVKGGVLTSVGSIRQHRRFT